MEKELDRIYSPIEKELQAVERRIHELVPDDLEPISAAERYIFGNGGKRLRPALILLSAKALYYAKPYDFTCDSSEHKSHSDSDGPIVSMEEGIGEKVIDFAVAAELIHTATLVHDDLLDGSALRRQHRSVNSRWGNEIAMLLGDHLYLKATRILTSEDILNFDASAYSKQLYRATNIMLQTASKIFKGELMQYHKRGKLSTTEEDYFDIIESKSASFISSCCIIGGLLVRDKHEAIETMERELRNECLASYGFNLGVAFQIKDDILDLMGDENRIGKAVGSDLKEGRITLPMIHLIMNANDVDKGYVESILKSSIKGKKRSFQAFERNGFDKRHLRKLKRLLLDYGSIAYSIDTALKFTQKATKSLEILPDSIAKQSLVSLADQVIKRDY